METIYYEYKAVPFSTKGHQAAQVVSDELTNAINQHANQGWEFVQLADVKIEVQPGCLAGLLGAGVSYTRFDQIIFRRPV